MLGCRYILLVKEKRYYADGRSVDGTTDKKQPSAVATTKELTTDVPVIRDTNDCLLTLATHELNLILDVQHRLTILHASHIPHRTEHCARVAFVTIFTQKSKPDAFPAMTTLRLGTFKVLLAPSLIATMQAIWTVVGFQLVRSPIKIQSSVLDPISGAANGLAKVGCVMGFVELGRWKAEDYVLIGNEELLDGGTLRKEGER